MRCCFSPNTCCQSHHQMHLHHPPTKYLHRNYQWITFLLQSLWSSTISPVRMCTYSFLPRVHTCVYIYVQTLQQADTLKEYRYPSCSWPADNFSTHPLLYYNSESTNPCFQQAHNTEGTFLLNVSFLAALVWHWMSRVFTRIGIYICICLLIEPCRLTPFVDAEWHKCDPSFPFSLSRSFALLCCCLLTVDYPW